MSTFIKVEIIGNSNRGLIKETGPLFVIAQGDTPGNYTREQVRDVNGTVLLVFESNRLSAASERQQHFRPETMCGGNDRPMFGGNFVWSNDRRFGNSQPVKLFDYQEA